MEIAPVTGPDGQMAVGESACNLIGQGSVAHPRFPLVFDISPSTADVLLAAQTVGYQLIKVISASLDA